MTPGPVSIYECPNCKSFLKRGSILSGNTFGAISYSDGRRIASMLPDFPVITICSECENIFWIKKAEKVGELFRRSIFEGADDECENEDWLNAPWIKFLTTDEYFRVLDLKLYSDSDIEEERYIRLNIWWGFNDRIRENINLQFFRSEEEKIRWKANVKRLLNILDDNDTTDRLMKAELFRNLGFFSLCMDTLNEIEDENVSWVKSAMERECEKSNMYVVEISG
jgi:hypothetical protein